MHIYYACILKKLCIFNAFVAFYILLHGCMKKLLVAVHNHLCLCIRCHSYATLLKHQLGCFLPMMVYEYNVVRH